MYGWFADPLVGRGEDDAPDAYLTRRLAEAKKVYGSGLDALLVKTSQQLYHEYDKANYPFGGSRSEGANAMGRMPNFARMAQMRVLRDLGDDSPERSRDLGLRSTYETARR